MRTAAPPCYRFNAPPGVLCEVGATNVEHEGYEKNERLLGQRPSKCRERKVHGLVAKLALEDGLAAPLRVELAYELPAEAPLLNGWAVRSASSSAEREASRQELSAACASRADEGVGLLRGTVM